MTTSIDPGEDRLHLPPSSGEAFRDAVTFSFGDPAARLYGFARLSHGSDGAGGRAVLYAGDKPVAASAAREPAAAGETWDALTAAGVRARVERPLELWTVSFAGDGGAFDLRFEACSAPAVLDADSPVGTAGGLQGYEQLCHVTGSVTHGGRTHQVRCLGQRGQGWGTRDWRRVELARTVSAWLGDDRALTLAAVRSAKSKSHLDEALSAFVFVGGEPMEVADPRLSTTYDGELRPRRAGVELWMDDEDEYGHRVAGEVLCGTSLDLGEQRLDSAFFQWRMEGRSGVGRYDVLRRVAPAGGRKRSR